MVATALAPGGDHVSNAFSNNSLCANDMSTDIPTSATTATLCEPSAISDTFISSCRLVHSHPSVRAINVDQLFQLHKTFVTTPLPSKSMFPWLHGVDGTNGHQNYFFGIDNLLLHYLCSSKSGGSDVIMTEGGLDSTGAVPRLPLPEHRGLMFIHASDLTTGRLVGSVSPSEILQPAPRRSSATAPSASPATGNTSHAQGLPQPQLGDINHHPQMLHQHSTQQQQSPADTTATHGGVSHDSDWADMSDDSSSLSSSSFSSTTSTSANAATPATTGAGVSSKGNSSAAAPSFSPLPQHSLYSSSFVQSSSDEINIRNFRIQVPRYALLSDIIVYAKEGEHNDHLLQLAKQISAAQDEIWTSMKELYPQLTNESRRLTFVLTDPFTTIESRYPELVAVSSSGKSTKNKVDFWEQEREQMALLTRASEIAPGVWLGNNTDVPLATNDASSLATPVSPGTSFSSYFFPPPSTTQALSQEAAPATTTAIPSTPPPEPEYPPLTPPSFNDHSNFRPSICVECRSGSSAPTVMTLDRIRSNVGSTPAPLVSKEIFHLECSGCLTACVGSESFPPSTSSLSSFERPEHVDVPAHYALRRATASGLVKGHQVINSILQTKITHLLDMAFFVHAVSNPTSPLAAVHNYPSNQQQQEQTHAHQVLIHCVDGYTESALLALCVLMIHNRLSLAEAYVKLQTDLGRSFFVYSNDAVMMLEVESQVWQRIHQLEASAKQVAATTTLKLKGVDRTTSSMQWPLSPTSPSSAIPELIEPSLQEETRALDQDQQQHEDHQEQQEQQQSEGSPIEPESGTGSSEEVALSSSLFSSSAFFSSLLNMTSQPLQEDQHCILDHDMEGVETGLTKQQQPCPFMEPIHLEQFQWFYHPEFEGSFPSRILPFLYLGNLAHASNPGLLKSLGIRYVLSVGEEAHGLNEAEGEKENEKTHQEPNQDSSSMENNEPVAEVTEAGTFAKRFMVKLVDDMYDNGVDSLWRHLENCVAFVDEARKNNARILIHCRVGVSRSATIVIAYLMAHYQLSLVDAYLMVRARRLSVIIQPNLLFMYELLQWEQRLRGQFDPMGWPGIAREVHSLNMYYIGS